MVSAIGAGRGGAGLTGREQQDRHAAADAILHHHAAFLGEFHRRHDETVGVGDEGPFQPLLLAARHHVKQLEALGDMGRVAERGADMLARSRDGTIERVEVHFLIVGHVTADHGALVEMDIVEIVHEPRRVIEVLRRRLAVFQRHRIDDMHRSARRAVMHFRARQMQIMFRIAGAQRDVARGDRQHVLDQSARKADPAILAKHRARPGHRLHARIRCLRQTDHFQRLQRRLMDLLHARLGQGLVLTARHARAHGPERIRKGRGPCRPPRLAPACPCRAPRLAIRRFVRHCRSP